MKSNHRKLAVIMFTDIFGYSGLMAESEDKGFEVLKYHDETTARVIKEYKGILIKRMGDATFSEFSSSLNAYNAALKLHEEIKLYNLKHPENPRLILRIGIHIGDVIVHGDDLLGNGVNTAARLEKLSVPGGICLSEVAHASIKDYIGTKFHRIDNVVLKNMPREISIYKSESIYPEEFPIEAIQDSPSGKPNIKIRSIKRIPPERLTFFESLTIAILILFALDTGIIYGVKAYNGLSLMEAFDRIPTTWFIFNNVFLGALTTIILLRSAMKITFEDVRGVDDLINLIVQKVGFKKPYKKNDNLVFNPTLFNIIFWSTQKMVVHIDGNNVIISGSYLFIRRVKKMLKAYEG
jgi:class 3 adenylate cyclase